MSETQNMGVTAEELDDLAWALYDAFPEVARDVNPVHNPDFWPAKATQLLPVINKIRDRARAEGAAMAVDATGLTVVVKEGREVTLDEALEKTIVHIEGCGWETGPYCTCGADPGRMEDSGEGG